MQERNILVKLKIFLFFLASILGGSYYKLSVPPLLHRFLSESDCSEVCWCHDNYGGIFTWHEMRPGTRQVFLVTAEFQSFLHKGSIVFRFLARLARRRPAREGKSLRIVNLYSKDVLDFVLAVHPDWTLTLRYHDVVKDRERAGFEAVVWEAKARSIPISTYEKAEAGRYGLLYEPTRVNREKTAAMASVPVYDAVFIGNLSGARRSVAAGLAAACRRQGLSMYLLLGGYEGDELCGYKVERGPVAYEECLAIEGRGRALIDLWRSHPREGYSYRIAEAFAMGRKVITNRTMVKEEPFYDKSRFFILGEDDLEGLREFLEVPVVESDAARVLYS